MIRDVQSKSIHAKAEYVQRFEPVILVIMDIEYA
jgi:hypothetical protein